MDCSNSENEMTPGIMEVKVELLDEDDGYTQNLNPLEPDIKIEEIYIKTECVVREAGAVLDTCRLIEDNNSAPNPLGDNSSKKTELGCIEINERIGKVNTTRYNLSHSCEPLRSDVINEEPTSYAKSINSVSLVNPPRARWDMCSRGVDILTNHNHSSSDDEEGSEQSSYIAHSLLRPSYVCDVCDIKFKNSRDLINHKVVHTGQEGFKEPSDLAAHKTIHIDQKPFVCDICEKCFRHSHHLTSHMRIHTADKPYACDVCNKEFRHSSALVAHKRIHTAEKPYGCDICKKAFSRSCDLVRHKRIHTGQKPYFCEICKKGFSDASNLAKHKLVHTGQKPYTCDICNKDFRHSSNLTKHKQVHTNY